jgi:hypothetical protein
VALSPSSNAQVKKAWNFISTLVCLHGVLLKRRALSLTVSINIRNHKKLTCQQFFYMAIYIKLNSMALLRERNIPTDLYSHIKYLLTSDLVVIWNVYRYCVCYTNGDVSYKVYLLPLSKKPTRHRLCLLVVYFVSHL